MIQKRIKAGETAEIDPRYLARSFAEKKPAEIIPLCWVFDPDKRPDIFTIRDMLRQASFQNKKEKKENLDHLLKNITPNKWPPIRYNCTIFC